MDKLDNVDSAVQNETNIDGEILNIVGKYERCAEGGASKEQTRAEFERVIDLQQQELAAIADRLPKLTLFRKIWRMFFPLMEQGTRVPKAGQSL